MAVETMLLLFALAAVAGFVDSMAGGGGLLTIPGLLLAGLSPVAALATNKLQACAGSAAASLAMIQKGIVSPKTLKMPMLWAFLGASAGAILVQWASAQFLTIIIPLLVAGVGLYTLFAKNLGKTIPKVRLTQQIWQKTVVPVIGFYDGYFGPATGTFFALSGALLRGMSLLQATGAAKLLNFSTNVASLLFFVLGGQVVWQVGFTMMAGQALGAVIGSQVAIKGGARFIRPMIVLMCALLTAKYVWSYWN